VGKGPVFKIDAFEKSKGKGVAAIMEVKEEKKAPQDRD